MAITRTQIAKQLLAQGGRIGLFKGAEADARAGRGDISPGTDRGGNVRGGNGGNNYTDRIIDVAERKRRQDLRDITNRIRDDKIEEDLEKFRDLGSTKRKVESFASKFSPIAMFASKFGPLNTKDFFLENYLSSKNALICDGFVSQHPPIIVAPSSINLFAKEINIYSHRQPFLINPFRIIH